MTRWQSWFGLTQQERILLGGLLAIVLVGLMARYIHLRNEKPDVYDPKIPAGAAEVQDP